MIDSVSLIMAPLGPFWPAIKNERDVDDVTRLGLWVCFILASLELVFSAATGSIMFGLFEGLFFFLAGVGVRERSIIAGVAAFWHIFSALWLPCDPLPTPST